MLAIKRLAMCAYAAAVWTYRDLREAASEFLEAFLAILMLAALLSPIGWVYFAVCNLREAHQFRKRITEATTWRKQS